MFRLIFKFCLSFALCFIVLSFNIDNKPVFYHISKVTGPIGADIQNSLTKSIQHTYAKSKILFTNSVPSFQDSVKSKKSGIKKKAKELEELKDDERKRLNDIIKNN